MPSKSDTRSLVLSLLIGFILAAGIVGGAKLVNLTNKTAGLTSDIQAQRHAACVDQNNRHDKTVASLGTIILEAEKGQSRQRVAQLNANQNQTLLLINDLAPKQDCSQVAP